MIPFSRDAFLAVFEDYNCSLWPAQLILAAIGGACVVAALVDERWTRRVAMAMLAGLWLWMAVAYHWLHFTVINRAAWSFGALFLVQAGLFALMAVSSQANGREQAARRYVGLTFVAYALVVYPILAELSDHDYPNSPTFGLPCPTTILTLGVLLSMSWGTPNWLFIVPISWAVIGSITTFTFGIWEDLGLTVAALITVSMLLARRINESRIS